MKRRTHVHTATLVILFAILAGCRSQPQGTEPPPATEPPPTVGVAKINSVEVQMLGAGPVDVQVIARGDFPDGCTMVDEVTTDRQGNLFIVNVTTIRPGGAICTEALVAFERVIPLEARDLAAGTYEVSVNGVSGSFELTMDNVPMTPTPTAVPASSVRGRVWHDLCGVATGADPEEPVTTGSCIEVEDGGFRANGELEDDEPGLAGVVISLGEGNCPQTGLATTITDAEGSYTFADLESGTYCLSIDPLQTRNSPILVPGQWTFPSLDQGFAQITLDPGEEVTGVNFGWDFQFLPAINLLGCTDQAEFVEDVTVPDDTVVAPGETFVKTWRIRNVGTCTWGPRYFLVFVAGDLLGGKSVPLPVVSPEAEVDLSIEVTAPEEEGTYRGDWQIRNPDGELFGIGLDFGQTIFFRIAVAAEAAGGG